jgi:hypothetical protein
MTVEIVNLTCFLGGFATMMKSNRNEIETKLKRNHFFLILASPEEVRNQE